ncbi:hypothetical protein [Mucilaginibacter sp. NFR10]|uniref:hypothetical protein n=1 Tax=Mucilaginibacter sp. NFR10 TaxID=1566292 RepID=UPI0008717F6A|nr:hypothetical protein [Mucilaginibacter sp. NFR10]SCW88351.1 hypothetical protein SAMN03159284_05374 [Mucilaginibacter sp. NFR10]
MKSIHMAILSAIAIAGSSCRPNYTSVGENTFIHDDKVYRVIGNEVKEIGDMSSTDIPKLSSSKPQLISLKDNSLNFIKRGAYCNIKALFRNGNLYYTFKLFGINDLSDNYLPGRLTVDFIDEYGFVLHSAIINTTEMTKNLDDSGNTSFYSYTGKVDISEAVTTAIKTYSVSASLETNK